MSMSTNLQSTDTIVQDLKTQMEQKFEAIAASQGVHSVEETRATIDQRDKLAAKLKLVRVAAVLYVEYLLFSAVANNKISLTKHKWSPVLTAAGILALYLQYQAETDLSWKLGRKFSNLKKVIADNKEFMGLLVLGAVQSYVLLPYYTKSSNKWGKEYIMGTGVGIAVLNLIYVSRYVAAIKSTKPVGNHRVAARMLDDYDNQHKADAIVAANSSNNTVVAAQVKTA
jgi:hypothetical protein